jgi:CheY-like chemotaxis protein
MKKTILLIDDDGMITKTIGNLLRKKEYLTEVAESGAQAIEKIQKPTAIDLIVTDIRMPQMNGLEAVRLIKQYLKSKKLPDIPVIFITGYADSDDHVKAKKYGKVIFKPFDINEFMAEVERNLQ